MNSRLLLASVLAVLAWGPATAENEMYVTPAFAGSDEPRTAIGATDPLYSTYLESTNSIGSRVSTTEAVLGALTNAAPSTLPVVEPVMPEREAAPEPSQGTNAPVIGVKPL